MRVLLWLRHARFIDLRFTLLLPHGPRASERETFDHLFDAGFNRGGKQAVDEMPRLAFYMFRHGLGRWTGEQGRPFRVSSNASIHFVRRYSAHF